MRWRDRLDNRQWSICRPPTIEFNNDAENRELDYIDLGSGIAMYAVNNGLQHLPEHLKNYLNDTDYHHWKTDRYAGSIRANGKSYLVYVPAHVHCNEPILLSASLLGCAAVNLYVVVGSSATISFTYDQYLCTAITMHLEPYAQVHWKHCNEHLSDDGYTFVACYQQQESRLIFNGWYTRTTYNNMFFILREPKAHVEVTLGLHAQDAHHAWFNTTQIHQAAQTMSNVILKGLLAASSRSVHRGMIHIQKHAQQSDARLTSRYLLLHNDAQAYAVPSLEVLTNDVTCAHGSSIGSCDDAHLFYLMSRGIALDHCYQLLTDAFFADLSY
jgi:Fe-S cluster assembly scaffold protein SufB